MSKEKWRWILGNWKIGCHLLLRTKRFGVNNRTWSQFDSMFGLPLWKVVLRVVTVYPLLRECRAIKARTVGVHFLTDKTCFLLWRRPFLR